MKERDCQLCAVQDALADLVRQRLERSEAICAIHTLGFTGLHDAAMLNTLTRAGTAQVGTSNSLACSALIMRHDDNWLTVSN